MNLVLHVDKGGYSTNGKISPAELLLLAAKYTHDVPKSFPNTKFNISSP